MDHPRNWDDFDTFIEFAVWNTGGCGYTAYPEGTLTDTELRAWRKELRERQARRRPLGFAPWPDE